MALPLDLRNVHCAAALPLARAPGGADILSPERLSYITHIQTEAYSQISIAQLQCRWHKTLLYYKEAIPKFL